MAQFDVVFFSDNTWVPLRSPSAWTAEEVGVSRIPWVDSNHPRKKLKKQKNQKNLKKQKNLKNLKKLKKTFRRKKTKKTFSKLTTSVHTSRDAHHGLGTTLRGYVQGQTSCLSSLTCPRALNLKSQKKNPKFNFAISSKWICLWTDHLHF